MGRDRRPRYRRGTAGRPGRRDLVARRQRRPGILGTARRNPAERSAPRCTSRLAEGSHADGVAIDGDWLRTGDLGVYLDGELYVTGRIADLVVIDGRNHYPQDIEATTAEASPMVRRGYVDGVLRTDDRLDDGERLVIVAERAAGTGRADPQPAIEAIRAAVSQTHGLSVVRRPLPAGGRHPAHHQRKAGPPGLPRAIPQRRMSLC